ncbi:hypothetical protein HOH45_07070 [bacterium]|jgi:hypothetical protein|nr:hypothetical protein [bacterium]
MNQKITFSKPSLIPKILLKNLGPLSKQCLFQGFNNFQQVSKYIQQLPYRRISNAEDLIKVLSENKGTCSSKHAFLGKLASELNLNIMCITGIYMMSEKNTPGIGNTLEINKLDAIPEAHCFLKYKQKYFDLTNSHSGKPLNFVHLKQFSPDDTGVSKTDLHKTMISDWAKKLNLNSNEIWKIREDCIKALSEKLI